MKIRYSSGWKAKVMNRDKEMVRSREEAIKIVKEVIGGRLSGDSMHERRLVDCECGCGDNLHTDDCPAIKDEGGEWLITLTSSQVELLKKTGEVKITTRSGIIKVEGV